MQRIDPEDLDPDGGLCPACDTGPKMWFGSTCDYCGWEEDNSEYSPEKASRPTGANGRWSLSDFRENYESRKELKPDYIWSKHQHMKNFAIDWTQTRKKGNHPSI